MYEYELETKDLGIQFGGLKAVSDVNFRAKKGEITAIIGPNGAGKTTMFNLIAGFYRPTTGRVLFEGRDVTALPTYRRTEMGMVRTFQNINLFKDLSVMDNILVGIHCRTRSEFMSCLFHSPASRREEKRSREKCMEILEFMNLHGYAGEKAGSLSYGMQKNLEVARALATDPNLILLDEPASGLNTQDLDELSKRIVAIREKGITVVLIEHKMDVVMSISDHIMVLSFGQTIAEGTPEQISNDKNVIEAYLGKDDE